jgi:hypothetical protein
MRQLQSPHKANRINNIFTDRLLGLRPLDFVPSLGAPYLDFEMWETTNSMELLRPVRDLASDVFILSYLQLLLFAFPGQRLSIVRAEVTASFHGSQKLRMYSGNALLYCFE